MAKRSSRRRGRPGKPRASWRGMLRFGLVSFQVEAINAHVKERSEIHFHLLHAPDHQRIQYAKICPRHGEVPNDEIVEGFEVGKNRYVEFEKDELDNLRTKEERTLTIDAFVQSKEIDPIYFDGRMYYLVPAGASSQEPYALLAAAMERKGRWGVGQVVFSGREQLVVVRPVGGVLTMAMLNYAAEIRKPHELTAAFGARPAGRKARLAEELIDRWRDDHFELAAYRDRYRQKVKQAIEAKRKGRAVSAQEPEEPAEVINLMDALKRSVEERRPRRTKKRGGVRRKAVRA